MKQKSILSLIFILLTSVTLFSFSFGDSEEEKAKEALEKDISMLLETEKNTIRIFEEAVNSVVNVSNIKIARSWDYGEVEIPAGAGSGFVWDNKGHIVTNYHVIANGDSFLVTFHGDSTQYKAKVIGSEPRQDIAVLKLEKMPKVLSPIKVGDSKNLRVGQKAVAIGNPFGLDHTVTTGIISALGRKIQGIGEVKIHGMIQTDTSINPGNSGGPLLDSNGRLMGMNTMIYSASGSSAGVGFAVPVDSIKRIVPQLIKYGKVMRPGLGIGILPDRNKTFFGVDNGLIITYIEEGSPADQAGLKGMKKDRFGRYYLGDIITAINGEKVNSYDDIYHELDKYKIGDVVTVTYKRNGKNKQAKIKLQEL